MRLGQAFPHQLGVLHILVKLGKIFPDMRRDNVGDRLVAIEDRHLLITRDRNHRRRISFQFANPDAYVGQDRIDRRGFEGRIHHRTVAYRTRRFKNAPLRPYYPTGRSFDYRRWRRDGRSSVPDQRERHRRWRCRLPGSPGQRRAT